MNREEMEGRLHAYESFVEQAALACQERRYKQGLESCIAALPLLDALVKQREQERDGKVGQVEIIEMILLYAPLVLADEMLDKLESYLSENRRIEKKLEGIRPRLDEANEQLKRCFRLWRQLEDGGICRQSELRQILGGEQDHWRGVAERWDRMGVVSRVEIRGSYDLTLTTKLGEICSAKCSRCGKVVREVKRNLLALESCPICRRSGVHLALCD